MEQASTKITDEIIIGQDLVNDALKSIKNVTQFKKKIDASIDEPVTELVKLLLAGAIFLDASDLHLEPTEENTRLRVRIDGMLQDVTTIQTNIYETLLSRTKLISGVKLNIMDRPQDGRFSIILDKEEVEVRTSVLPSEEGEAIVLRILNPKTLISLEESGMREDLLQTLNKEAKKPSGMIIVTGPTGSGKTTTLYGILKKIKKPEIKIITIEDPIEYHLAGISQTQIKSKKGYDFANGLKAIMRQDPDVILVGEVRDLETADISLQASLTGHLVLSTLHTNDAVGTVARMTNLGVKPADIGSAINLAIAQRLVRVVCKKCVNRTADAVTLKKIKDGLKGISKTVKIPTIKPGIKLMQAKGCVHCNKTGYRGRVAIFEFFAIDNQIEKFILTSPSTAALQELADKKGMVSLFQDGLIKVLEGITTLQEVERVTGK